MHTIAGIHAEDDPAEPEIDLATALVRLTRLVQEVLARASSEHELTATQSRLLCVLTDGPQTMGQLAGTLGVEKAAMTGLIDRIERRGLVERVTGTDRRSFHIRLTHSGETRAFAVHREVSRLLDAMAASLPADRRRQLGADICALTGTGVSSTAAS